jgi:GNAT superfamily N-acetyltransferase
MVSPTDPSPPLATDDARDRGRGLHAVCALVIASLDRARRLTDDRPELALATLARWLAGEDGPAELHDAMELMVQATFDDREVVVATRCVLWAMRVSVIDPWRGRDVARRVVADAAAVLVALGDEHDAAAAQVDATYRAAVEAGRARDAAGDEGDV